MKIDKPLDPHHVQPGNDECSSFRLAINDFELKCNFNSNKSTLEIHIEDQKSEDVLGCVYNEDNFPTDFKILYENVPTFYSFISVDSANVISYERGSTSLIIKDFIGRKTKIFNLPLGKIQLTNEEILVKRWRLCADKLAKVQIQRDDTQKEVERLKQVNLTLEEKCKSLETELSEALKKMNQNRNAQSRRLTPTQIQTLKKKVSFKIPTLESHLQNDFELYRPGFISDDSSKESCDFSLQAMIANKDLTKFIFQVNKSNDNLRKYIYHGNVFEKAVGKFIPNQVHSMNAIQGVGKYYFTIKILVANNNDISIGVMGELCIENANSKGSDHCIAYYGDKGIIKNQQEEITQRRLLQAEDVVTTVVDLIDKKVSFFINDSLEKTVPIIKQMGDMKLYPFFEIGFKGNKIELNV